MGFSRIELADKANVYQPFLPDSSDMQKRLSEMPALKLKELYEIIWRGSFPDRKAIRHFSVLENQNIKKGTGSLICLSEESLPLSEDSITIPVRAL